MKVLVIGGAGYIGSALVEDLVKYGIETTVLDVFLYGEGSIKRFADKIKIVRADFRDLAAVKAAMSGVNAVIHLGAIVGDQACDIDKNLTMDVNFKAAKAVFDLAVELGIPRFLFSSTCSVYGASEEIIDETSPVRPLSTYGESKVLAEKEILKKKDICASVLRFGTVFGISGRARFDLVVNLFAAQAIHDKKITVFGGNQWRPFIHVKDAARALFFALKSPAAYVRGRFFNACYDNFTIQEAAEEIQREILNTEIINNGMSKDPRDYFVSSASMNFLGFKTRYTLQDGIQQVQDVILRGVDYKASIHNNFKYLSEGAIKILQDFNKR